MEVLENRGVKLSLPPQINADTAKIRGKLLGVGIIDRKGSYSVATRVLNGDDADIIRYFKSISHGLLSYDRCADNFR